MSTVQTQEIARSAVQRSGQNVGVLVADKGGTASCLFGRRRMRHFDIQGRQLAVEPEQVRLSELFGDVDPGLQQNSH